MSGAGWLVVRWLHVLAMALFVGAPFIGLAYVVLMPFVGLGMLVWVALGGDRKKAEGPG